MSSGSGNGPGASGRSSRTATTCPPRPASTLVAGRGRATAIACVASTGPAPVGDHARRLWRLPLAAHAAALFVLLLVVLPLTKPGTAAMSDEGAAIVQGRLLEHTGSWLLPRSLPGID